MTPGPPSDALPVSPPKHHLGMSAVALWAGFKSAAVFLIGAGFGLLLARGESAHDMAEWLVTHLHAHRESRVVAWFLDWSDHVTWQGWVLFFCAVLAYSVLHAIEAWGIWRERRWAEWLAALSGVIYLPFEIWEMAHNPGWLCLGVIFVNASIVVYMAWMLWSGRRAAKSR